MKQNGKKWDRSLMDKGSVFFCGIENHGLGPWFRRASSGVLKNPR